MPELIFWNVQRLGGGSDLDKAQCIDLVIDGYLRPMDAGDFMFEPTGTCADGIVLCEVTSDIVHGGYQISKFGTVPRRGRRATAQLGYGGVMWDGAHVNLVEEHIANHDAVFGFPISYRGGNAFANQSQRKVMRLAGTPVFVYHANSSYKAATLVHWVAGHLKLTYGDYILVGDLNCSWSDLDDHMRRYDQLYAANGVFARGEYRDSYAFRFDEPTHHVHYGLGSILDWAVYAPGMTCHITTLKTPEYIGGVEPEIVASHPDHLPILLEW